MISNKDRLTECITQLESIAEILFAIQLTQNDNNELDVEKALDVPIQKLGKISSVLNDISENI